MSLTLAAAFSTVANSAVLVESGCGDASDVVDGCERNTIAETDERSNIMADRIIDINDKSWKLRYEPPLRSE
jgi:hypothetical protein